MISLERNFCNFERGYAFPSPLSWIYSTRCRFVSPSPFPLASSIFDIRVTFASPARIIPISPFFYFPPLLLPFLRSGVHYRQGDSRWQRKREILTCTVELRASSRETCCLCVTRKKRRGRRGGRKVNYKVFLIGGVYPSSFLLRRGARLLERRHRLTFDPLPRSLLARAPHFLAILCKPSLFFFFYSRENHHAIYHVFSSLLLPSLSLFYYQKKNIKIKRGKKNWKFLKGVSLR